MATPRKRWFRVADKLGADPIPNDELATFIRVLALLNTRRARDMKDGDAVNEVLVGRGELARLADCDQAARAERVMRALEARGWLVLESFGANDGKSPRTFRLRVSNFADFQELPPGDRENAGQSPPAKRPENAPSDSDSGTISKTRERGSLSQAGGFERRSLGPEREEESCAPEELDESERLELRRWATEHQPTKVRALLDIEAKCLAHARSKGWRRASWPDEVRKWITSERLTPDASSAARPVSTITEADRRAFREVPVR